MNKERLEWIVSGLNQYALTEAEEQFLKTALEDFDKNQVLTQQRIIFPLTGHADRSIFLNWFALVFN